MCPRRRRERCPGGTIGPDSWVSTGEVSTGSHYTSPVRVRDSAAVTVAFVVLGSVAACGGSEPTTKDADPDVSGDKLAIGTAREAPLEEPCQWLSIPEATGAMEQAGINAGSDIRTMTNSGGDSDALTDCWYLPVDTQAGRLVVTLVSSKEAATNWRTNMKELAAQGGHEVTEHGQIQTLTRIADAPALQLSSPPGDPANCDVHALLGDDSVVSVALAAADASDADAACSETNAVLETVVERLPKSP